MAHNKIWGKIYLVLFGLLALIVLGYAFNRNFYGIEITDEAFIISESILVNNGATPFVNNWSQTPGFVVFARLPALVWSLFHDSHEGIFLFYRLTFLLFKIVLLGGCHYILCDVVSKEVSVAAGLVLIPFYIYMPNFHYNNISVFMALFIGCCLVRITVMRRDFWLPCCIVGGLMALCIYMHPSDLFAVMAFLIAVMLCEGRQRRAKAFVGYCTGGLLMAVFITIWMLIRGGGIANLLFGLDSVLNYNAYFQLEVESFIDITLKLIMFSKPLLCILICVTLIRYVWNGVFRAHKLSNFHSATAFLAASLVYALMRYTTMDIVNVCGMIMIMYLIYRLRDVWFNDSVRPLYCCVFMPLFVSFLSVVYLSYGSAVSRLVYMIPCVYVILHDIYENVNKIWSKKLILLSCTFLFAAVVIKSNYSHVYREEPIPHLICRVEQGIYKGLYTTEARKELFEELEIYLNTVVDKEKSVLYMEVVPMAYLMTEARYCTPSTWDITLYSYGFNDDTIMQRYFQSVGKIPNYIIYIDTGRDEFLSVTREDYKFTQFVLSNYELQSTVLVEDTLEVMVFMQKTAEGISG